MTMAAIAMTVTKNGRVALSFPQVLRGCISILKMRLITKAATKNDITGVLGFFFFSVRPIRGESNSN
jgi:hypothetical protein